MGALLRQRREGNQLELQIPADPRRIREPCRLAGPLFSLSLPFSWRAAHSRTYSACSAFCSTQSFHKLPHSVDSASARCRGGDQNCHIIGYARRLELRHLKIFCAYVRLGRCPSLREIELCARYFPRYCIPQLVMKDGPAMKSLAQFCSACGAYVYTQIFLRNEVEKASCLRAYVLPPKVWLLQMLALALEHALKYIRSRRCTWADLS